MGLKITFNHRNYRGLFTSSCLLCLASHQDRNMHLCRSCKADLPWISSACRGCGLPLPQEADHLLCGECLHQPAPFQTVVIPFHYAPPISPLINSFKHHQKLLDGQLLGQLLAEAVGDHYIDTPLPELIIPVPLHWQRFLRRGYNQSAELAKQLSSTLGIPYRNDLLKRRRKTPRQQGLNRTQRLRNLQDAFCVQKKIPATRIALLDDVVTTGVTSQSLAELLYQQGVQEVHLWAIARTPVEISGA